MPNKIHYSKTKYGFEYGSVSIERVCDGEKNGWVFLRIKTPRQQFQIYATKSGKVRLYEEKENIITELVAPKPL